MTRLEKLEHRLQVERTLAEAREGMARMRAHAGEKEYAKAAECAGEVAKAYAYLEKLHAPAPEQKPDAKAARSAS